MLSNDQIIVQRQLYVMWENKFLYLRADAPPEGPEVQKLFLLLLLLLLLPLLLLLL